MHLFSNFDSLHDDVSSSSLILSSPWNTNDLYKSLTMPWAQIYSQPQKSFFSTEELVVHHLVLFVFQMAWSRDFSPRSTFIEMSDVYAQTTCLHEPLRDGETYDVWIKATDIMNNTKVSSLAD